MENFLELWEDLEADAATLDIQPHLMEEVPLIFPEDEIEFEELEDESAYVDDEKDFNELNLGDFL